MTTSGSSRGVIASICASVLFGFIFYVAGAIDASAEFIFAWRMLLTAACFALALLTAGGRRAWRDLRARVGVDRWKPVVLVAAAALVGFQMWLFAWSPLHGHGLDASLGYLLLPIALVLVGRVVFAESVTRVQWIAVAIAVVAVAVKLVSGSAPSWVTFAVCLGYPVYFALRKHHRLTTQAVFGAEVALLGPLAIVLVSISRGASSAGESVLVAVAGLAGAAAMTAYLAASRLLSLALFGLLSYGEPVLLFVASLLLGESLAVADVVTYALLALALATLAFGGFRTTPRQRSAPAETLRPAP